MKAIVYHEHGPPEVLRLEEVEKPTPNDDQVLIRVRAAAINPLDWRLMRGGPGFIRLIFKLMKLSTMRPGRDVAGEVEAVGSKVTRFKRGDEVFGACIGSLAEYACAFEASLALKPSNVTFEQAAATPVAGLTALQGLRDKAKVAAGQSVLINGAAGGVGTFAVQIGKVYGATVTGVCSTPNLEMVRSIGADRVIDYTKEDVTKGDQRYDVIFECIGNLPLSDSKRILNPKGIFVLVGAPKKLGTILGRMVQAPVLSRLGSQKFVVFITKRSKEDLTILGDLMTTGKVTPVIDRRYTLSESREAIRYLETCHARGKVVITPGR